MDLNSNKVSIAVVTNPLSVIMANRILFDLIESEIKILIIDHSRLKTDFKLELLKFINKKNWNIVIDLSRPITNETDLKPGLKKRLTRKYKHFPFIRFFYKQLHQQALKRITGSIETRLKEEMPNDVYTKKIELFLLTQTYSNAVLIKLFPEASLNYFEHGIGDYAKSAELKITRPTKFWGIFAKEYSKYNSNSAIIYKEVTFSNIKITPIGGFNKKAILILMQNLEIYGINKEFWEPYLNDIINSNHPETTFLVKPHPLQSNKIIDFIQNFFQCSGRKLVLLPFAKGIEIEFENFSNDIYAVYSPFSSSLYYLNKLYNTDQQITFYQSLNRVHSFIGNAPAQYKNHFVANYKMVKEVFGKDCIEF